MSIGPWDFNFFDILVLVVLLISLLFAAQRGLVREVLSILALFVAAIVALIVVGRYQFAARDFVKPEWLADYGLGLGTFILAYLIMVLILSGFVRKLKGKDVGLIDRILGAGFGVARGLLIMALIAMAFTASYRSGLDAQETKRTLVEKGIYEEMKGTYPKSFQQQMEASTPELKEIFANSTFYPLLAKIGDGIRALPFTKMQSYADRIKEGGFESIVEEIQ